MSDSTASVATAATAPAAKPRSPGRAVRWDWLGRLSYADGQALQERARDELRATGPRRAPGAGEPAPESGGERLLLLEHGHVYTLGRNATVADVLLPRDQLEARGIEVAECDRGGQVTYHGPGQLVGYPVIDLDPDRRDIRRYVRDLQESLIRTLAHYGIEAEPREGQAFVGVWVGEEKIASLGIHLKRWITTHGFALNVATDLDFFGGIVACGLPEVRLTSLERLLGEAPPLPEVAEVYARCFGEVFERRMVAGGAEAAAAP